METRNAIIKSVEILIEDHGHLTAWLNLEYGGGGQGFGGYVLDKTAGIFLRRVIEVVGVPAWNYLVGKPVRVIGDDNGLIAIGNIIQDKWFYPSKELSQGD